jgi:hypothetical protein
MGEGGLAVRRGFAKEGAQMSATTDRRRRTIDWASADVHDGDVTVELSGKSSKAWRERFDAVLRLLGGSGGGWGEVKLTKGAIRVKSLQPRAEDDLRHFLESLVVQVNAELPTEQGDGQDDDEAGAEPLDRGAILDAEMTATLRSFAQAPV